MKADTPICDITWKFELLVAGEVYQVGDVGLTVRKNQWGLIVVARLVLIVIVNVLSAISNNKQ